MMRYVPIFSEFILTSTCENIDNDILSKYAYKLKDSDEGKVCSNLNGWQSYNLTLQNPIFKDLIDNVLDGLAEHIKDFGFESPCNIEFDNMWYNINGPSSMNRPHTHEGTFSGVYYVKTNGKDGDLVFQHSNLYKNWAWPPELFKEPNIYNSVSCNVKPKEGVLVLFPTFLEHYVEPNTTNEDRISISFNLSIIKEKEK